ncbi:MAG: FAD-binding protein [Candidatus Dadabacteria bacterium]|nr:FAD-binding protein [Candidatus Dadabacteria bacterium]NIX14574.1 FAD-binding protein [Candidatus Dadabacteria bacterium]
MDKALKEIENVVGAKYLSTGDQTLSSYRVDFKIPTAVIYPGTETEISEIIKICSAYKLSLTPYGNGTKISTGNIPTKLDLVLSTSRLDKFVEHGSDDLIATGQAGITLQEFQSVLKKKNQQLAAHPPNLREGCTLGGMINTNDYGPSRLRYGSVKENLLALKFLRADGRIVKGGAKVVKNVAGYDIPKLITGSLGTLGIITEATFRLYPLQPASNTIIAYINDITQINEINNKILNSDTLLTCFEICNKGLSDGKRTSFYAIKIENVAPAVQAQTIHLQNLLGNHDIKKQDVLTGSDETEFWDKATNFYWQGNTVDNMSLRIRVQLKHIPEIINIVEDINIRTKSGLKMSSGAGLGIININLTNEPGILKNAYVLISKKLMTLEGHITILRAPEEMKRDIDIWGKSDGTTLNIMREIKHQFDPANILNPGRFAGWI